MLIYRIHLVFLILKQHLLSVICFTHKKAGLMVIERKAFNDYTLFCAFAALIFQLFTYLFLCIHFSLQCNKFCHDFYPKFIFNHAYNFLVFSYWLWPVIILWISTCIKLCHYIICNVFVKIFCLYLIYKAVHIA